MRALSEMPGILSVGAVHLALLIVAVYVAVSMRLFYGVRIRVADISIILAQVANLTYLIWILQGAAGAIHLFAVQLVFIALILLRFVFLLRKGLTLRRILTVPRSIREAIDFLPGGLCFSAPNGRPILTNRRMNELVYQLTGHAVANALYAWDELERFTSAGGCAKMNNSWLALKLRAGADADADDDEDADCEQMFFSLNDGSIWRFRKQELADEKSRYIQIEASQITELFRYSSELYENNQRLAAQYARQQGILANIVEINQAKELLHAKMKIHDDLGRSIIMTKRRLSDPALTVSGDCLDDCLIEIWTSTIRGLHAFTRDSDPDAASPEIELRKAADMIGCRINIMGDAPKTRRSAALFYATVREALTNAVTHAKASRLDVVIEPGARGYEVRITDNGTPARTSEIKEGGGLGNLRRKLEQEGATLDVRCENGVALFARLPA